MLVRLSEPRRGASVHGLLVRRLQDRHAFTVEVNGALMVRPRLAVRSGSGEEAWQPVHCHCRRAGWTQSGLVLGLITACAVSNILLGVLGAIYR